MKANQIQALQPTTVAMQTGQVRPKTGIRLVSCESAQDSERSTSEPSKILPREAAAGQHQPGEWVTGVQAWDIFVHTHPELGYSPGMWPFHNFLRHHRDALVRSDAVRRAKNRFWIAHVQRFKYVAFECATGAWPHVQRAA